MLPGGLDATYRNLLAKGSAFTARIDIWQAGQLVWPVLEFEDARLQASLASGMSRRLSSVTCDGAFFPHLIRPAYTFLDPTRAYVKAYAGVILPDGNERYMWQVFRGRVGDIELSEDGKCRFNCLDRGAELADNTFPKPANSQPGNTVSKEFVRLVKNRLPDANIGQCDDYGQTMPSPGLSWDHDAAEALDEIAVAVGSFWYPLANGDFVLRRVPWTFQSDPILTLDQRVGAVTAAVPKRDRQDIYNRVTVNAERADGSTPVYVTVQDNNPDSATFIDGPFGVRGTTLRLRTPQTVETAAAAGRSYLQRTIANTEPWRTTQPIDAALELGDVALLIDADGREIPQVAAAFDYPLSGRSEMSVQWRNQVLGLVSA